MNSDRLFRCASKPASYGSRYAIRFMERLINLRPFELIAFVTGVVIMVYATINRYEFIYLIGATIGFGGITAFLVTESYGRLAQGRSIFSRWIARIFLVPSTLISVYVLYLIVRWSLYNAVA